MTETRKPAPEGSRFARVRIPNQSSEHRSHDGSNSTGAETNNTGSTHCPGCAAVHRKQPCYPSCWTTLPEAVES